MTKQNINHIFNYLNNNLINQAIEKTFSQSTLDYVTNIYSKMWSREEDGDMDKYVDNYSDTLGINDILYELDALIDKDDNDDSDIFLRSVFKNKKKKRKYEFDELNVVKKDLLKVILKMSKSGFFDEIFQIKALRLNSLFENINKLTDEEINKNKILNQESGKYQLDNLENWIDNNDFVLLKKAGCHDLFQKIVMDSFPYSLKNISLLPEKYKDRNKLQNLEADLFRNKRQEFAYNIRNEIKNPKYLDMIEDAELIKYLSDYIIGSKYDDFNLQEYMFDNYLNFYLINQSVDVMYEALEKYSNQKDKNKYTKIIDELKNIENSTDEKPLTDLLEYAKKQKNYKVACLYLEINSCLSKNLKKLIAADIVKEAIKNDVSFHSLNVEKLSIYSMISDLYKKQEYENKREDLFEQISRGIFLEIPELESKIITVEADKFIYMFQKDYREQSFKVAMGFSFNNQFGFHIDQQKNQVRISFEYEGVSKMNNNDLLLDSIELIEIMLNKQESESFFHKMKLKSKINMSPKEETEKNARKKI